MSDHRFNAMADVWAERGRQFRKWGDQQHPSTTWAVILGEEYGEVCRAIFEGGDGLRDELIQVAAVAVAWVEYMDRRNA